MPSNCSKSAGTITYLHDRQNGCRSIALTQRSKRDPIPPFQIPLGNLYHLLMLFLLSATGRRATLLAARIRQARINRARRLTAVKSFLSQQNSGSFLLPVLRKSMVTHSVRGEDAGEVLFRATSFSGELPEARGINGNHRNSFIIICCWFYCCCSIILCLCCCCFIVFYVVIIL